MPRTSWNFFLMYLQVPTAIDSSIIPALVLSANQWRNELMGLQNINSSSVASNLHIAPMVSSF